MSRDLTKAYKIIKEFEGLRLKPYLDSVGVATIGWGTTVYPNGKKVSLSDPQITESQAQSFLEDHVEMVVDKITPAIKEPCNDNQFCAFISFSYNVGVHAFTGSTLLRLFNAGNVMGAADEFPKWNKGGGKVLKGLVRRRKMERELFLEPEAVKEDTQHPLEAELDEDVVETPSWFEPFKALIIKIIEALFSDKNKGGSGPPDNPDNGLQARPGKQSEGSGPRITFERCQDILKANDCEIDKLNLIGIRGYYLDSSGVKGQNDRGVYDDALIWVWKDGFYTYRGNVDPSKYRKGSGFGSAKGVACLKVGKWRYLPGMHNGSVPHLAFRQADKVTVIRDGSPNYPDTGWFGINIHRGGKNGTSSLGCQTLPPAVWDHFKATGDGQLKRHGQKTFNYLLVNETDLRRNQLKVS